MVPLYFTDGPLQVYEQEMRHPPYERRPGGGLYVCPSTTAAPSLPSHTQVSKMSYRQLVSERFHGLERSLLWQRIEALTAGAAGLHYNGAGHLERIRACQPTDGPVPPEQPECKWYAALYLLAASGPLWRQTAPAVTWNAVDFTKAVTHGLETQDYALYQAARSIYSHHSKITAAELADEELVCDDTLRLIVDAVLIAQYDFLYFLKTTDQKGER